MEDLLTVQETSSMLRISPDNLRSKVRKGEIKASKPANRWLFKYSDILIYLDKNSNIKNPAKGEVLEGSNGSSS